jgi:ferritin-like metal-binding protein YciE
MGLFSESFNSFDDLFSHQLEDVYDAEEQLIDALPKMADASTSSELKNAFNTHLMETREHARRLEQVFGMLGKEPSRTSCPAMKGLVKEGSEVVSATGDGRVKDAGLIAAAQRVEHYEIAGYGTVRTFAQHLGKSEAVRLLQETLNEEAETDKKLTGLAEKAINPKASAMV